MATAAFPRVEDGDGRGAARGPRIAVVDVPDLHGLPPACRQRLIAAPPRLNRLTAAWIAENEVGAIVTALFGTRPDVWQIAGQLRRQGFAGRMIALSPVLPNRHMVERELRAEFPALRLRLLPLLR